MIVLAVPQRWQDEGSWDCGRVCVQMILEHFGLDADRDKIDALVPVTHGLGSSVFDQGTALLRAGLQVEAISAQPMIFTSQDIGTQPSVSALTERLQTLKGRADQDWIIDTFVAFLAAGGTDFHAVVACGHRGDEVLINDPHPASNGASWVDATTLVYGVNSTACSNVDNGWLLSVGAPG